MTDNPRPAIELVEEFLSEVNRHNVSKAMKLLDKDFVFRDVDADPEEGMDREMMEQLFEWDKVIDSKAGYETLDVDGDEVSGIFTESNKLYRMVGIEKTLCKLTFRVKDGKVAEQIIEQVLDGGPTFDDALEPFIEWAEENAAEELEAIQPDGVIVFTSGMAKRWVKLLGKWKDATGK